MKILSVLLQGVVAAFKGVLGVASFGILAIVLPILMLKMKGREGYEIVTNVPKLKATRASVLEVPNFPKVSRENYNAPDREVDQNSFSFGNSINSDSTQVLDRSVDPNR